MMFALVVELRQVVTGVGLLPSYLRIYVAVMVEEVRFLVRVKQVFEEGLEVMVDGRFVWFLVVVQQKLLQQMQLQLLECLKEVMEEVQRDLI